MLVWEYSSTSMRKSLFLANHEVFRELSVLQILPARSRSSLIEVVVDWNGENDEVKEEFDKLDFGIVFEVLSI